jgi:hypothetical protein
MMQPISAVRTARDDSIGLHLDGESLHLRPAQHSTTDLYLDLPYDPSCISSRSLTPTSASVTTRSSLSHDR